MQHQGPALASRGWDQVELNFREGTHLGGRNGRWCSRCRSSSSRRSSVCRLPQGEGHQVGGRTRLTMGVEVGE
eukprot:scaffold49879_cov23-Tisochrysis_lutea.AAC.1